MGSQWTECIFCVGCCLQCSSWRGKWCLSCTGSVPRAGSGCGCAHLHLHSSTLTQMMWSTLCVPTPVPSESHVSWLLGLFIAFDWDEPRRLSSLAKIITFIVCIQVSLGTLAILVENFLIPSMQMLGQYFKLGHITSFHIYYSSLSISP